MEQILKLDNVTWRRGETTILKDVNWQVNKGQHWAILGLNGSGKTTLLKMINGYIWPTTGKMEVLGCKFGETDIRKLRTKIGWVSSSLMARIKGSEDARDVVVSGKYASIGLYESPSDADYQKALELMELVGAKHLIGRSYETCSQGEQQKLLIARGLMADPDLLILDEPTNGLDFISRETLLQTIEELAHSQQAPTMILVTHHTEEILPVFSHTLLLREGSSFAQGLNQEVLTETKLSAFFRRQVSLEWENARAWLRVKA